MSYDTLVIHPPYREGALLRQKAASVQREPRRFMRERRRPAAETDALARRRTGPARQPTRTPGRVVR